MTSIIIINWNGKEYTTKCIESMQKFLPTGSYEIIVVDNNSMDGSNEFLSKRFGNVCCLPLGRNMGFGSANNAGSEKARGEYLFFLNNDTEVDSDVLTPMVNFLEGNREAGIAGPRLLNSDGSFQLSFGGFPGLKNEFVTRSVQNRKISGEGYHSGKVDWVSGAALMIRSSLFREVGGFDEKFFMYFEDSDLCLRAAKRGYTTHWLSECTLVHHKGKSYDASESRIPLEYRKSQLHYYGKNKSAAERIVLKIYLFIKFSIQLISGTSRDTARKVLKLIITAQD